MTFIASKGAQNAALNMLLITGMSGSGKSVALNALEDAGYYCVDNLPPELLASFIALELKHGAKKVAIAMDVRSATSLPLVPRQFALLRDQGVVIQSLFLDSSTETLVRRFSETRRLHPLSRVGAADQHRALIDAIELEREVLGELREQAHVLDTSMIRSSQLQEYIKSLISNSRTQLTLVFQSFAFKRGVPLDADFVFDVRMLPNPHYELNLRSLTGKDPEVIGYLRNQVEVGNMLLDIENFVGKWMQSMVNDHRSYVTVAVGCTGGQHRSVYLVEELTRAFSQNWHTLKRHRELNAAMQLP